MDKFYNKNLIDDFSNFQPETLEVKTESVNDRYAQRCNEPWKSNATWQSPNYAAGQQVGRNLGFMPRTGFGPPQPYGMSPSTIASPSSLSLRDAALLPIPPTFERNKNFSHLSSSSMPNAATSPKVPRTSNNGGDVKPEQTKSKPASTTAADACDLKTCGFKPEAAESEDRAAYPSFRFMKLKIRLAIRAANHPRVILTPSQLQSIGDEILERILGPEGQRVRPRFYGMCVRNGVLAMACGDQTTAAWVRELSEKLNADGIPLEVVEESGDGKIFIAVGHFPKCDNDSDERILKFLECQNEGLDCSRWRVLNKSFEKKAAVRMTFSIDFASAQLLKVKGPLLNFKFAAARFMLKTRRGVNFKEEEYEEDDEGEYLDNFPPEEEEEDVPKPFSYAETKPFASGSSFGTTSKNPFAFPGEYETRVAKIVEKSKNALRFGLTSRERFLSSVRRANKARRRKRKNKNVKREPT